MKPDFEALAMDVLRLSLKDLAQNGAYVGVQEQTALYDLPGDVAKNEKRLHREFARLCRQMERELRARAKGDANG